MNYYQAGYQGWPLVSCGVNTGHDFHSRSLTGSLCERDQVRAFNKPGVSSEKQPEKTPQAVVPRGAFEHASSRAAANLPAEVSSQSPYSRRQSYPVLMAEPGIFHSQTAMVLPKSLSHANALPCDQCPGLVPNVRTVDMSMYNRPSSGAPPTSHPLSSSHSSQPWAQEVIGRPLAPGPGRPSGPSIVIVTHPCDVVVCVGERVEFTCKAFIQGSTQNPRYVWYKDNQPLVWEIGQSCELERVRPEDAGVYLCLVCDPQGMASMRSHPARLTVKPSPVASSKEEYTLDILKQPERSIQGVQGEPLRLEIIVRGHPPPTYQWYKDTVALPYATSAVLEIESMSASSEGEYCCSVTNALGSKLSARCTVQALLPRPLRPQKPTSLPGLVDQAYDDRQSAVKSVRNVPQQSEEPLSEGFLRSLSSTISTQRCTPLRLGSYLELSNQEVADIARQAPNEQERTYLMLRAWGERKRKGRGTLVAILTKAGLYTDIEQSTKAVGGSKLQILMHPKNPVRYGNPVTLRVSTDHTHQPTGYQWYKDGRVLERRCSQELSIYSVTEGDCGEYSCAMTTLYGEVLHTPPTQVTMVRENPQRRVSANYGVMVTSNSHARAVEGVAEIGQFVSYPMSHEVMQEGGGGGQPSTVHTAHGRSLRIISHPQSQQLQPGDPLTITCFAEGPTPLSYLWLFNGLPLINETEPTYRINCFTDEDEGLYACEVTAGDGSSTMSDFAEVKMNLDD